jgi:hypothetical protein
MLCRFNVILDLDETFVNNVNCKRGHDKLVPQTTYKALRHFTNQFEEKGSTYTYTMFVRPHFDKVADFLFENFNVGVITAGTYKYALNIIKDGLLQGKPNRKLSFFFTRETFEAERFHFKGNKNLEYIFRVAKPFMFAPCNTIFIDDLAEVMQTNQFNVLQVPAWRVLEGSKEEKTYNKACLEDEAWLSVEKALRYLADVAKEQPCTLKTYYVPCPDLGVPLLKWVKAPKDFSGKDHQVAFANWETDKRE